KRPSLTDQDGHDRIAHFVGESAPQAFTGYFTAADKPDAAKVRFQSLVHQAREIASVELYGVPRLLQCATGENKSRLVAVGPTETLGLEIQRCLIGPGTHHVAVDRLEERLD